MIGWLALLAGCVAVIGVCRRWIARWEIEDQLNAEQAARDWDREQAAWRRVTGRP